MTYIAAANYTLPIEVDSQPIVGTPRVDPLDVSVVVPVKDDLSGLLRTLRSLLRLTSSPRRIRVVDDGSSVPVSQYMIEHTLGRAIDSLSVHRLPRNRGPAVARDIAVDGLSGWIYFTDCACEHPPNLFESLSLVRSKSTDHTIAIAAPVLAPRKGRVSRYMTEQGNLNPPMLGGKPQAVITANVLVHASAGTRIGWFDPRFSEAGGEDIDFGLRLRRIGDISWDVRAPVFHDFEESLLDFDRRFSRYGRGMRILAEKWRASLDPFEFQACSPDLQDLADRQFLRMNEGYRQER